MDDTFTTGTLSLEAQIMLSGESHSTRDKTERLRLYYTLVKGGEKILDGAVEVAADTYDQDKGTFPVTVSETLLSPALWSACVRS